MTPEEKQELLEVIQRSIDDWASDDWVRFELTHEQASHLESLLQMDIDSPE